MNNSQLLISCEGLDAIIDDADVRVVDCRFSLLDPEAGRQQYLESHVPNAVYADLDKDLAAPVTAASGRHPLPEPDEFRKTLERLGISNSTRVICYDHGSGALAARLWWMLRWAGHHDAALLDGGFDRWQVLGFAVEEGEHEFPAGRFELEVDADKVLSTADIMNATPDASALRLVDAREEQRFLGDAEPIDPVAGRIPGALNMPFQRNLADDGVWKTASEVKKVWQETFGDDLASPWSVMCGSGVTACHLVVSGLLAGLPEPKVYVGSWSEWIRDSERPVATGVPSKR